MNAKRLAVVVFVFAMLSGFALAQPALAEDTPVSPVVATGIVTVSGEAAWDGFALGVVSSNGALTQTAIVKSSAYTATVFVGETVKVFHEHKCANLSTPLVFTATVGADLRLPDIVVECRQSGVATGSVEIDGQSAWDGFALGVVSSNGALTQTAIVKSSAYTATVFVGETVKVFHEHKCANLSTPLVFTATVGADLRLPSITIECRWLNYLPAVMRGKILVDVAVMINDLPVSFPFGIEFRKGELHVGGLTANGAVTVEYPEYGVWSVEHDHPCAYEPKQVMISADTTSVEVKLTCK